MSRAQKTVKEVLLAEIKQVRKRRQALAEQNAISEQDQEPVNPHDLSTGEEERGSGLTGLALSGGGVRAAAFSVGVIQGLYTAGRMKAFDFLSTVSGGGYAGALFSSEVARSSGINWESREKGQTNRPAGKVEGAMEALATTPDTTTAKPKPDTSEIETALQKHVFDSRGIAFAVKTLKSWFKTAAANPAAECDSSVVEIVCSWAKEQGLDAPAARRQEFCKAVAKLVKENIDTVKREREVSDDFGQILSDLGGRSKLAVDLRKHAGPATKHNV